MRLKATIIGNNAETYQEWEYTGDITDSYLSTELTNRGAVCIDIYDDTRERGAPYHHLGTYEPNAR
tara:strand:+ start:946 stop:1143 length:198 start_codon:yes stop_codon:yes gene_type:complete